MLAFREAWSLRALVILPNAAAEPRGVLAAVEADVVWVGGGGRAGLDWTALVVLGGGGRAGLDWTAGGG
jgi:hypothetical protein